MTISVILIHDIPLSDVPDHMCHLNPWQTKTKRHRMLFSWTIIFRLGYIYIISIGPWCPSIYLLSSALLKYVAILLPSINRLLPSYVICLLVGFMPVYHIYNLMLGEVFVTYNICIFFFFILGQNVFLRK